MCSVGSLTAGEAGLLMRTSRSSRKHTRIERFNFFSSAFLSACGRGITYMALGILCNTSMYRAHTLTIVSRVESLKPLLLQWTYHSIFCLKIRWEKYVPCRLTLYSEIESYVKKAPKHVVLALYWGGRPGSQPRANILIRVDLVQGGWRVRKGRYNPFL